MTALIVAEDLDKTYALGGEELRALDDVSLTIERGEFVAIMGASGSGKSTLMNILGCLDRPTTGRYVLAGREVSQLGRSELAEVRNQLTRLRLPELQPAPAHERARERGAAARSTRASARNERSRARARALERVGLGERLDHRPSQLSGGQQQRVAIARAIVNEPRLVLADEPTGNLDSKTSASVMALFQELWRDGLTIVYVTHEPDVARVRRASSSCATATSSPTTADHARRRASPRGPHEPRADVPARGRARSCATRRASFLTMLGVIIGVASVISMVAVGEGAKARVEGVFAAMGTNLLIVLSGSTSSGGVMGGFGSMPTLTWDDLARDPHAGACRPRSPRRAERARHDRRPTTRTGRRASPGTTPEYFDIRAWKIARGALFDRGRTSTRATR